MTLVLKKTSNQLALFIDKIKTNKNINDFYLNPAQLYTLASDLDFFALGLHYLSNQRDHYLGQKSFDMLLNDPMHAVSLADGFKTLVDANLISEYNDLMVLNAKDAYIFTSMVVDLIEKRQLTSDLYVQMCNDPKNAFNIVWNANNKVTEQESFRFSITQQASIFYKKQEMENSRPRAAAEQKTVQPGRPS